MSNNSFRAFNRGIGKKIDMAVNIKNDPIRATTARRPLNKTASALSTALFESASNKLVKSADWYTSAQTGFDLNNTIGNNNYFESVSKDTADSIRENSAILDALPDLEWTMKILVNSILSPNDMMVRNLNYQCLADLFGDTTQSLLDVIRDYYTQDYNINTHLADILKKALFLEGSYISVILPESTIDDAINSNLMISKETLDRVSKQYTEQYGWLGIGNEGSGIGQSIENGKIVSLEVNPLGISITDNFEICKLPKLRQKARRDKLAKKIIPRGISVAMEHTRFLSTPPSDSGFDKVLQDIYPERKDNNINILRMKTLSELDKPTVGHPLELVVPHEAFIPVYQPGDPSNHVGGFILLDGKGNPVRLRDNVDQTREMANTYQSSLKEMTSGLISKSTDGIANQDATKLTGGYTDDKLVAQIYANLLEKELADRLTSGGVYEEGLKIGIHADIMNVMFTRALEKLETKLVFVPDELFCYLAFDYKDNGIGRSIIEKTKTLSSIRMVQNLADALANVRNAIDHKTVTITLDPNDPDPMKTTEETLHAIQRSTQASNPVGLTNYNDISSVFQKSGIQVKTEGHEGMPDMAVSIDQNTRNYPRSDSDYRDSLRDNQILAMGLSPDSVSGIMQSDYATSVVSSNAFLARDALDKQLIFNAWLTDWHIKYTRNSSILVNQLLDVIKRNREMIKVKPEITDWELVVHFINNIKVELPPPDMTRVKMQKEALSEYADTVDAVMPYILSNDLLSGTELGDRLGGNVDRVTQILKGTMVRKFITDNNILPEMFDALYTDNGMGTQLDFLRAHSSWVDQITPLFKQDFIDNLLRSTENETMLEKIEEKAENSGDSDSDSDYDSDDSDDSDSDDDGGDSDDEFGDDDFDDFDEEGDDGDEDDDGEGDDDDLGDDDFDF